MFGLSLAELIFIIILAIVIIPVKSWPSVFKFFGKVYRTISDFFSEMTKKVNDVQAELEKHDPIDDISKNTFDDVLNNFSEPIIKKKKTS